MVVVVVVVVVGGSVVCSVSSCGEIVVMMCW